MGIEKQNLSKSLALKFPIIGILGLYENPIQKPPHKSWIFNAIWVNRHHRFENK
jgi:hypothetical protein